MGPSGALLQARPGSEPMADGRPRLSRGARSDRDRTWVRTRTLARRMDAMNVKIDDLVFDRADYDADGDVLYLARGETDRASDAALTPEGHGVRYDTDGAVIGVTIINARWILEHEGHLTITLPHAVRIEAADVAPVLA